MRDPWKLLAVLLGFCILLVVLWRVESTPADVSGAEATIFSSTADTARAQPVASGYDLVPLRHAAKDDLPEHSPITLLLRLVSDGVPLERAGCELRASDGSYALSENFAGTVVYRNLEPGTYALLAVCRGYYDREETLVIAAAPVLQEHEVTLQQSFIISVRFMTPEGERLMEVLQRDHGPMDLSVTMPYVLVSGGGGAPVLPLLSGDDFSNPLAIWDDAGFDRSSETADGTLSLRVMPPLMLHAMIRHVPLSSQALDAPRESLEWIVDPTDVLAALGSVRVRILDPATGTPPENGRVFLAGGRAWLGLIRDKNGWYEREKLPPGVYALTANFGMKRVSRQVTVLPGENSALGDLLLNELTAIEVRVMDSERSPVAGARILLTPPTMSARPSGLQVRGTETDAQGVSITKNVPAVQYLATASPPIASGLAIACCEVALPSAAAFELVTRPGVLVSVVTERDLDQGRSLCLLVEGRAPLVPWRGNEIPARVILAPGEHAWSLLDAGGAEIRRGTFLVPNDLTEVRVEVPIP